MRWAAQVETAAAAGKVSAAIASRETALATREADDFVIVTLKRELQQVMESQVGQCRLTPGFHS